MVTRNLCRCVSFNSLSKRRCSTKNITNEQIRLKRYELFKQEKERQMSHISRIEKIEVNHLGPHEPATLHMNKYLSTPFNCAMHCSHHLMTSSALALVNNQPWDMHRPLESDCELRFLHFKEEDPQLIKNVNEAFWRTCSFVLGYVFEKAFKDNVVVELCSFPKPNIHSGSFIYDMYLPLPDWQPTQAELTCLSRIAGKLSHQEKKIERLDVDISVALKMFEDNKFKSKQIPAIAAQSTDESTITLYQMDDHVDISRGPMLGSTSFLYRFSVTAVHDILSDDLGSLKRVQGLCVPNQLPIHWWTFDKLAERSRKLNPAPIPQLPKTVKQMDYQFNG